MGRSQCGEDCVLSSVPVYFVTIVVLITAGAAPSSAEDVARRREFESPVQTTPPMGWNPWNQYGCSANETIIRQSADALVATGLARLGYDWVHLDDCWMLKELDTEGRLQVDVTAYPTGMKALGDHIHSKGLKFGIYASSGNTTCQKRAGTLGHEVTHAQQFAEWGVDGLKYDNCNPPPEQILPQPRYAAMASALATVSRPIYLNVANNGQYETATWASQYGSSWVISEDIEPTWDSVTEIADLTSQWAQYAGPTLGWNDADMLEVGNGDLTFVEAKAHFSVWAIVKSPLFIGTDLVNMTAETHALLSNKEVIDVNQDSLGAQATVRVHNSSKLEVWAGPLSGNRVIVILWNRSEQPASITAAWGDVDLPPGTRAIARDLWQHIYYPNYYTDSITLGPIAPHDVVMIRLEPGAVLPAPVPYILPMLPLPPANRSPANDSPAPGPGPRNPVPAPAPALTPNPQTLGVLAAPAAAPCSVSREAGNCTMTATQVVPATSAVPVAPPPSGAPRPVCDLKYWLYIVTGLLCTLATAL